MTVTKPNEGVMFTKMLHARIVEADFHTDRQMAENPGMKMSPLISADRR